MKCTAVEDEEIVAPASLSAPASNSDMAEFHGTKRMSWLREPLLHFLVIGLTIFLLDAALNHGASPERSYKIALTAEDLRQLQDTFASQWRRTPSFEEMRGLEEARIHEEVLYREALMLGLDRDDIIVKRRLAQKIQFLAEDVAVARQPTTGELKAWYASKSARFGLPSRFSFRQLYFSPDRRGQRAHEEAMKALARIATAPQQSKAAAGLADPFMFQDYYADRTPEELEKDFGLQFASAVPKLRSGSWQGPVESGYGWHLVFVDSVIPGRTPVFEEVQPEVKAAWLGDQKQQALQKAYRAMRAKYTILLPDDAQQRPAGVPLKPSRIPVLSPEGPL